MKKQTPTQMKKQEKERLGILLILGILAWIFTGLISAYNLIDSVQYFWIGYHNLDMGQNMRYLGQLFNATIVDNYAGTKYMTSAQSYLLGVSQLRASFWGLIIWSFSLGISIPSLAYLVSKFTKFKYEK